MSEVMIPKEMLGTDPLSHALVNLSDNAQEAIGSASDSGVSLSIDNLTTYRKELRAMICNHSFLLVFAMPQD